MTPNALVLIAPGSEEIETVVVVDVLRRAKVNVTLADVSSQGSVSPVKCSRGVVIHPDTTLSELCQRQGNDLSSHYDIIVLPGGLEGAKTFKSNDLVQSQLKSFWAKGKYVAAICAAPMAVAHALAPSANLKITSHPSVKQEISGSLFQYIDGESVVIDGNLITSRCPGTSFDFALAIVEALTGTKNKESVRDGLYAL